MAAKKDTAPKTAAPAADKKASVVLPEDSGP